MTSTPRGIYGPAVRPSVHHMWSGRTDAMPAGPAARAVGRLESHLTETGLDERRGESGLSSGAKCDGKEKTERSLGRGSRRIVWAHRRIRPDLTGSLPALQTLYSPWRAERGERGGGERGNARSADKAARTGDPLRPKELLIEVDSGEKDHCRSAMNPFPFHLLVIDSCDTSYHSDARSHRSGHASAALIAYAFLHSERL